MDLGFSILGGGGGCVLSEKKNQINMYIVITKYQPRYKNTKLLFLNILQ